MANVFEYSEARLILESVGRACKPDIAEGPSNFVGCGPKTRWKLRESWPDFDLGTGVLCYGEFAAWPRLCNVGIELVQPPLERPA